MNLDYDEVLRAAEAEAGRAFTEEERGHVADVVEAWNGLKPDTQAELAEKIRGLYGPSG